jgi:hypothetical protein
VHFPAVKGSIHGLSLESTPAMHTEKMLYRRVVSTDAQLYFFEARLPGTPTFICGVLVYDASSDSVVFRFRENWQFDTDEETAEILSGFKAHFEQLNVELGAKQFTTRLKSDLHNVISLSEAYAIRMPKGNLQLYVNNLCGMLQAD